MTKSEVSQAYSPNTRTLRRHTRLAQRERIHVGPILETGQAMVDEPVRALITPDGIDDVQDLRVRPQAPVIFRNFRRRKVRPVYQYSAS